MNYLSGCYQPVCIGGTLSKPVPCFRGAPKGTRSVLGPLLFILYPRQLNEILPSSIVHQEFADDIVLEASSH